MCGIAGYFRRDGQAAKKEVVVAMNDAIRHRGPDSAGYLVEGAVAIGMRRLSILDVAGGDQPIHSPDGQSSIVYNGENYNFQTERTRLEQKGRVFSTHTDTEVALALYEEGAEDGVERMRGMYAFAVWDRGREELFLARDRVGKKPLYWYEDDAVFLFGSELKCVLVGLARLGIARPQINKKALVPYMAYGYVPAPMTIFEGINKLRPAERMRVRAKDCKIDRYWTPVLAPDDSLTDEEHFQRLEETAEEAVRLRMISDVPLGAYLSGGIDSSTVVGLMARVADAPIKTFSIGFEDQSFDELPYAKMVAEHLGTEHHELIVKPEADDIIEDIVRHFDEPFADSSAIPTYYVSKMAREEVTVVLSGDGGDELFAGYSRYFRARENGVLDGLPLGLRRGLFGGVASLLPAGFFGRRRLQSLALDDDQRYVHEITCGLSREHQGLFREEFATEVKGTDPSAYYLDRLGEARGADPVAKRAFADLGAYLPEDILVKVDRMSMMVSLEARAPLLDHEMVELAMKVPTRLKIAQGESKHILRRLARKLVPAEAIDRKKQGFAIPISRWFNEAWQSRCDDLLDSIASDQRGIFRPETIRRLRDEHRRGRRDHSQIIWSLMMLELWFRAYVDDRAYSS